ncbi:hypothetical protein FHG87_009682 [Trinorchestia longiramus]|nr:hypothetical protein FHG87_009682 [Trinorchestia longiramus]
MRDKIQEDHLLMRKKKQPQLSDSGFAFENNKYLDHFFKNIIQTDSKTRSKLFSRMSESSDKSEILKNSSSADLYAHYQDSLTPVEKTQKETDLHDHNSNSNHAYEYSNKNEGRKNSKTDGGRKEREEEKKREKGAEKGRRRRRGRREQRKGGGEEEREGSREREEEKKREKGAEKGRG